MKFLKKYEWFSDNYLGTIIIHKSLKIPKEQIDNYISLRCLKKKSKYRLETSAKNWNTIFLIFFYFVCFLKVGFDDGILWCKCGITCSCFKYDSKNDFVPWWSMVLSVLLIFESSPSKQTTLFQRPDVHNVQITLNWRPNNVLC